MDADLEMIETVGTDDEGDLFEDPLAPARGLVFGIALGSLLWLVIILALWSIGVALFGE